jgi:hypothetical protein
VKNLPTVCHKNQPPLVPFGSDTMKKFEEVKSFPTGLSFTCLGTVFKVIFKIVFLLFLGQQTGLFSSFESTLNRMV